METTGKTSTKSARARARTVLLRELARAVADLVHQDHIEGLLETLNGTGYDSSLANVTSHDIGRAIIALAPLLDDIDSLACVVHTAAFHRHMGPRVEHGGRADWGTPTERMKCEIAEYRAQATLDRAGEFVLRRFLLRMNTERATQEQTGHGAGVKVH